MHYFINFYYKIEVLLYMLYEKLQGYLRNSDAIYAVSVFGSSVPTVPTRPIVANQRANTEASERFRAPRLVYEPKNRMFCMRNSTIIKKSLQTTTMSKDIDF